MNPNLFSFFPAHFYKILHRKNIIRNVDDLWPEAFYELGIVKSKILKKILDFWAKRSYQIPVAIIPVSQGYVSTITSKYHIAKEKIFVIQHGVDILRFNDEKNESSDSNFTKIMYSGVLGLGYDFETVIKCAKILDDKPYKFIIRGAGELADNIAQMISEHKLKNVELRTDLLEQKELVKLLKTADIFLLPMTFGIVDQGFPTKILEFQALGKPIVCISKGEAGHYIRSTNSGLVTDSRDPEELANLIKKLGSDRDFAKQLGINGQNYIKNNLTLTMIGKRFLTILRQYEN